RVPRGQKNNQLTMHRVEGIRHYDQAAVGLARQRGYGTLDLVGIGDAGYDRLDCERAGDRLERVQEKRPFVRRSLWVEYDRGSRDVRRHFLENLEPLPDQ